MASSSHNPAHDAAHAEQDAAPQSSDEPPIGPAAAYRPTLVGDSDDAVAFLDAPGLDAHELFDAVDGVLASMADGAILTVFTDDPTAPHIAADRSSGRNVELLAVIPHSDRDGTTLTFRRREPGSGPPRPTGPSSKVEP